jgi:hypothetical protein
MIDRVPLYPIPDKGKYRNAYIKRREENLIKFGVRDPDASNEAHQFVSRLIWLAAERAKNKAAQLDLIDVGKPLKGKKRATAFTTEAK